MASKNKKKSYEQLEAELELIKSACLWENIGKIIAPSIKWGGFAFIAKYLSDAIKDLSGKITAASINLNASASLNPDDACANWPYWLAALSAIIVTASIGYGLNQRKLRRLTVEHLAPFKEKYERKIDPNQSSSGLLNDGSTNPIDA